jgi:hypothetical protein
VNQTLGISRCESLGGRVKPDHGEIWYQRPEELTVFLPACIGGVGLGFTWSALKLLKRTKEERGFDEGHGVRLAARAIIQEPLFSFLNFNQAPPLPTVKGRPSFAQLRLLCHMQQTCL